MLILAPLSDDEHDYGDEGAGVTFARRQRQILR